MQKGYDEETAKKICGKLEQQTHKARFNYKVKAEPFTLCGGRYAKVQVIDTTTSKPTDPHGVRWRVTKGALTRALRTLLSAPLVGPPGLGHEGRTLGRPIQVKANGSAEAIYEITDPDAWEKIQSGEWGAVSPQVLANGEIDDDNVVTVTDFVFEHVALVPEGAFPESQVESAFEGAIENYGFAYSLSAALFHGHSSDRMARDDAAMRTRFKTPNQPQVLKTKWGDYRGETMSYLKAAEFNPTAEWPDNCFAYVPPSAKGIEGNKSERKLPYRWPDGRIEPDHLRNALARWEQTEFHSQEAKTDALGELCRAAKEAGIESDLCKEELGGKARGELILNEESKRIAELEATMKRLQGELATSEQKREILERREPIKTLQAELERLKSENMELKAWKAQMMDAQQTERATEVVDLRIRAGLGDERDREKSIEQLKRLTAEALDAMKSDLIAIVTQIESEPSGPKARFRARQANDQVEALRLDLYGYQRNRKGELVS